MPVRVDLDRVLTEQRLTAKALAERIGISEIQLSHLRTGKVRGIRFSTPARICFVLNCEPGSPFGYDRSKADMMAGADED